MFVLVSLFRELAVVEISKHARNDHISFRFYYYLLSNSTECAEASLVVGGSIGGDDKLRRKTSVTSASCRSGNSHSTFIESMPYIDGDGKPGHYTGHVDREGQPNGQGKMKYISGAKYDGVWHEGTKLHGKTSSKK